MSVSRQFVPTALHRWRAIATACAVVLAAPAVGFGLSAVLLAQGGSRPPSSRAGDPPDRVGRLTAIQGAVSFSPASDDEWTAAETNRPITTGDRLWSDTDGRAEVDLGSAAVRVWYQTELDLSRLDDEMLQARLPQGSAIFRLRELAEGEDVEIDTPNASVMLGGGGVYRFDVSPDGLTTTVTVLSGSAEVTSAGSSFALTAGQTATVRGDQELTYDVGAAGQSDGFDQWSRSRDDRENRATRSRRYVPADMPGGGDLDDYGDWNEDPSYGPVWYPRDVSSSWAPYRDGHWVWMGRWGWTWVDDAPWGYAPSHYGRWAYVNRRWGWCPGRVVARSVFAPSLVVFVGGSRGGSGLGIGVSWFPLAPQEVYRPTYAVSDAYVRRVNVTNVTNITNVTTVVNITNVNYRNREVAGAWTSVPRNVFETGAPVARAAVRVSDADIREARVVAMAPEVVPARTSLVAEGARRRSAEPPAKLRERPVVAVHAPPPAPVPFAAEAAAIAAQGGRPLSSQEVSTIRRSSRESPSATAMPTPPVRSAAERPAPGRELKAARAGLPEPKPAAAPGTPARPGRRAPTDAAPPSPQPAAPAPAPAPSPAPAPPPPSPTPAPPPRTAEPNRRPPPARPETTDVERRPQAARPPEDARSRARDSAFAKQRADMESKHIRDFAKPAPRDSLRKLSEQQDAEHAALEAKRRREEAAQPKPAPPPTVQPPPAQPPTREQARSGKPNAKEPPPKRPAKGPPSRRPDTSARERPPAAQR